MVAEGLSPVFFTAQNNIKYSIALDHSGAEIVNLRSYNEGGADLEVNADVIPSPLPARVYGNNVFATQSPEDNDFGTYATSRTVWWSWTPDATGTVRLDFRDSDFYPAILFYQVETDGSRTHLHNATSDSTLEVTLGTEYLICLAEWSTYKFGDIEFFIHWIPSSVPPNDDIENARQLPGDKIVCDGEWIYYATAQPDLPNEDEGFYEWEPE